ncbi:MAG: TRAP-type C4-dicarboxylate transport system permease small subunit [Reinekea sp.]|jgi:TRAP-type C4-dicarboxylate transport system permease small subunit
MTALHWMHSRLERFNRMLMTISANMAWVLVALMVLTILLQVFCRYVLNSALPWPEEVARAFMIWMMALVAAQAYHNGSFVAIDMLHEMMPPAMARLLKLLLLVIAALVLFRLFTLGLEFFERGFRTRAASFKLPRAWIYLAMPVCFGTMLLVNIELILKNLLGLAAPTHYQAPTGD